jgi:DNA-binding LacI/PurR family transcriptional regulator
VFAANDPAAIGAMTAITETGLRIPDDVAIVGGGNIHYGGMLRVPLTTVAWSTSEMGQNAARLLVAMVENSEIGIGAEGGSRTHTTLRSTDFKSVASAIPPPRRFVKR